MVSNAIIIIVFLFMNETDILVLLPRRILRQGSPPEIVLLCSFSCGRNAPVVLALVGQILVHAIAVENGSHQV